MGFITPTDTAYTIVFKVGCVAVVTLWILWQYRSYH